MFRPAFNNKTHNIDLIDIENCPNLEDYGIINIAWEANQNSISISWDIVNQEVPTRNLALEQEKEYEQKRIDEAVKKNKSKK